LSLILATDLFELSFSMRFNNFLIAAFISLALLLLKAKIPEPLGLNLPA
jgi:hypothetical protein